MGREGDALCNSVGYEHSDSCVFIQRSGIFNKRRTEYYEYFKQQHLITFIAEPVATHPSPPASCPPNLECIEVGYEPPFVLRVISPIIKAP